MSWQKSKVLTSQQHAPKQPFMAVEVHWRACLDDTRRGFGSTSLATHRGLTSSVHTLSFRLAKRRDLWKAPLIPGKPRAGRGLCVSGDNGIFPQTYGLMGRKRAAESKTAGFTAVLSHVLPRHPAELGSLKLCDTPGK